MRKYDCGICGGWHHAWSKIGKAHLKYVPTEQVVYADPGETVKFKLDRPTTIFVDTDIPLKMIPPFNPFGAATLESGTYEITIGYPEVSGIPLDYPESRINDS